MSLKLAAFGSDPFDNDNAGLLQLLLHEPCNLSPRGV